MTKEQYRENFNEMLAFCFPSTESKREKYLEKYLSIFDPSTGGLEDSMRASAIAMLSIQ